MADFLNGHVFADHGVVYVDGAVAPDPPQAGTLRIGHGADRPGSAAFAEALKRDLPRLPYLPYFWTFAKAKRALVDLHVNYESLEPYPLEYRETPNQPLSYKVERKLALNKDKTIVIINPTLKLAGIPPKALQELMRYGIELPNVYDARTLAEFASLAEQSGWDGIFLEDYIVHHTALDAPTYDSWVALAAMALHTERIRLGTTVTPLPL